MKPMASTLSRWGLEWAHSETSAKVQILIFRTKSGATSELVGSCPPLTDAFFTF